MQQTIVITGLQSSTFSKIIPTIAKVHVVFSHAVGAERLEECQIITSYRGMSALELSNRYFTSHKRMAEGSELVLSTDIDPMDILRMQQEQHCATPRRMLSYTLKGKGVMMIITNLVNLIMKRIITHISLNADTNQLNLLYLGSAT